MMQNGTENQATIAPEAAREWLRRAIEMLPEEDREDLLRPYRDRYGTKEAF